MAVDNQLCMGMDLSSLPPDVFMIQWREKQGEIEHGDGTNGIPSALFAGTGNGLREIFIDVTPYAPLFQQFLTKVPNLALNQAKKVQIDLIGVIFDSKRQAPFHYPVASGDYSWDATDATLFSSLIPATQNTLAKVNQIVAGINAQFPALDNMDKSIATQADTADESIVVQANGADDSIAVQTHNAIQSTASQVNSHVVNPGAVLDAQVNTNVVAQGNAIRDQVNAQIVNAVAAIVSEYNNIIRNDDVNRTVLINASLLTGTVLAGGTGVTAAMPGLAAAVGFLSLLTGACSPSPLTASFLATAAGFANISAPPVSHTATITHASRVSAGAGNPWTAISNVTNPNVSWIPIGGTAPVPVTPAEAAAIMSGIAARTNSLTVTKNHKIGEVNALTTIGDVIDYDVTAGW